LWMQIKLRMGEKGMTCFRKAWRIGGKKGTCLSKKADQLPEKQERLRARAARKLLGAGESPRSGKRVKDVAQVQREARQKKKRHSGPS